MNATQRAAASILLGTAVLAGLVWFWRNGGDVGESSDGQSERAASSHRLESESGESAGNGATTTVVGTGIEALRKQEPAPPSSTAAPEIYEDWISRTSLLTGTPDIRKLIQVLEQLAATATAKRTSGTTGKISFRNDPNTVGEYSLQAGADDGVERIKVVIRTTAPQGSVLEDPRFAGREIQFEFARRSQSNGFTSQVCLLGRESGRMTSKQRDDIYGSSSDPINVGFRATCTDTETRIDRMTLQIRREDDGTYKAWLVGGDGVDAVISPSRTYSATLDAWRRTLGI
jgi:hypothetical protein